MDVDLGVCRLDVLGRDRETLRSRCEPADLPSGEEDGGTATGCSKPNPSQARLPRHLLWSHLMIADDVESEILIECLFPILVGHRHCDKRDAADSH